MGTKIGKITHFYDHIGVAVVKLGKGLKVGDKIKISGHDHEFTQSVASIQLEHKPVKTANPRTSVGLKVDQTVKENDLVYKIDEDK